MAAKLIVDRNKYRIQKTVAQSRQDVTVPANVSVPVDVQYLLKPVLFPRGIPSTQVEKGKVRVSGQLEGLLCCVSENESVIPVGVEAFPYTVSFIMPGALESDYAQVKVEVESVEVDMDAQKTANITAFISVQTTVTRIEEICLVTDVTGADDVEKEDYSLQIAVDEVNDYRDLDHQIDLTTAADKLLTTEVQVTNLNWQVLDGNLIAEGKVVGAAYYIKESNGQLANRGFEREFSFNLDLDIEATDAWVECAPELVAATLSDDGNAVDFEVGLSLVVFGYREINVSLLTGVGDADYVRASMQLANRIGESEFKINLDGDCQFPVEPTEVLSSIATIRVMDVSALDEKVMVQGLLSLLITYADIEGQQRIIVREDEFSQFFALSGSVNGMEAWAWAWSEGGSFEIDGDGVHYTVPALFRVDVVLNQEINPVVDLHIVDPEAIPANASIVLYRVQKGENLFAVAKKFNVTQRMLQEYNKLSESETLSPGAKIVVPLYLAKSSTGV